MYCCISVVAQNMSVWPEKSHIFFIARRGAAAPLIPTLAHTPMICQALILLTMTQVLFTCSSGNDDTYKLEVPY